MEKSNKLIFKRADDTSALSDFCCGVQSMDNFIHDKERGLEKFIKLKLSNLWIVYENGKAVAFFSLSKSSIILNNVDREVLEQKKQDNIVFSEKIDAEIFWNKERYPAVEIDYLAVCQNKRNDLENHLGTYIVEKIAQAAIQDKLTSTMFLTVDALDTKEYSAVRFYQKCGFGFSEKGLDKYNNDLAFGNQPKTRRMYRLIIPVG